ncbi:tetratricopeptide repeat protein [Minwuia sp.]|uniref:tetratricopeptide repeat protein n=1 Tax=Minwuia sp. TaxID=2493630 RepID=UPI003A94AF3F
MMRSIRGMASVMAVAAIALSPVGAFAMGSSSSDDSSSSSSSSSKPAAAAKPSDYKMGVAAVEAQDWDKAITHMSAAIDADPQNADAFNYLGYAKRKSGDHLGALKAYRVALDINPEHKGAHEYIGQAYLEIGNVEKAEEHLQQLDSICTFGCAEYTSLKKAVSKAKGTS